MMGVGVGPGLSLGCLCSSHHTPTSLLPRPQPGWLELILKASFWILKRKKDHCSMMLKAKVTMTHLKHSVTVPGFHRDISKGHVCQSHF